MAAEAFGKSTVPLIIDNDKTTWYHIYLSDWIAGTFIDNGCLKAFEKQYLKRAKGGFGYKLVTERINGISLNEQQQEAKQWEGVV